jgi:hypothetical protein
LALVQGDPAYAQSLEGEEHGADEAETASEQGILTPWSRTAVLGRLPLLPADDGSLALAAFSGAGSFGFNTPYEQSVELLFTERLGPLHLLASAAYGAGIEDDEHNGSAMLATLLSATDSLRLGLHSEVQMDLERDEDEPENEPDYRALLGPLATYSVGSATLAVGGGLSLFRFRQAATASRGPMGYVGLSAAF